MKTPFSFRFTVLVVLICFSRSLAGQELKTGLQVLIEKKLHLLEGKKIGIVTNHTAILPNGTHLVDTLHQLGFSISALFGPEHGIRGNVSAGDHVENSVDEKTGIPVYSLYGKTKKPTREMLQNVDILLFDIQDAGVRFYTYISTLYYTLEAGGEFKIPVIVLDRPNPLGGIYTGGPVLKKGAESFVGISQIPIAYGMTIGELAKYFSGEENNQFINSCSLTVIEMEGWRRSGYYDDFTIPWIKPSPNITNIETILVYPGTCLIESTNISEGRGTNAPFLMIGAPFIEPDILINELKKLPVSGFLLTGVTFTPEIIPGVASKPKLQGITCKGIKISVTDRSLFNSVEFGICLLYSLQKLYPDKFEIKENSLLRLGGDPGLYNLIKTQGDLKGYLGEVRTELEAFNKKKQKYLIYH